MKKIVFLSFMVTGIIAMAIGGAKAEQKEIKIGSVNQITGYGADYGIMSQRGQEKAVADINAAGGIRGAKIVLVTEDDRSDRIEALALIKKLAGNKDIMCLSVLASIAVVAGHPLFEQFHIPMVSSGSGTPWRLTPYKGVFNRYTFRQQLIADSAVPVMLDKLKPKLNLKNVATIFDIKNDWTVNNKEAFVEHANKLDVKVTAVESCTTGDTDFRAQITKMKRTNPDLVFVSMTTHEKALFIRQARDMGWTVQFMDLLAQQTDFKLSGGAEEGIISCAPFDPTENRPLPKMLVKWYKANYKGNEPPPFTALGYDNILLIADAAKRAKTIDREAIRDALGSTKNFEGACGFYTWNDCGDNITPIVHFVTFNNKGELIPYKF